MLNMCVAVSLYGKFGPISKGSEDMAAEGVEKTPFAITQRLTPPLVNSYNQN